MTKAQKFTLKTIFSWRARRIVKRLLKDGYTIIKFNTTSEGSFEVQLESDKEFVYVMRSGLTFTCNKEEK